MRCDGDGRGASASSLRREGRGGRLGVRSDGVACGDAAQRLQIVADVERAFAFWAEGLGRGGGNGGLAAGTFQIFDWWHEGNDNRWHEREIGFGKCRRSWRSVRRA